MKKKQHKLLKAKIEKFLSTSRDWESQGADKRVDVEDVGALYDIIRGLVRARYVPDYDSSDAIECILVDRSRFERMHFLPVPYAHLEDSNIEVSLDCAILNSSLATERVYELNKVAQNERLEAARVRRSIDELPMCPSCMVQPYYHRGEKPEIGIQHLRSCVTKKMVRGSGVYATEGYGNKGLWLRAVARIKRVKMKESMAQHAD